jgi:hydrogenase maturation factor
MTAAAETAKAEADKKVSRSNRQTEEAKARAAAATEILDGIKAELDSDEFATKAEQLVALGNASAAREAALAAWGRKHTNAAKKAIVDAYSLPVMELGGTPTQSAKRRFRLTASAS